MMAAAPSKTVCLRAFNEDLGGTNPWDRQGPTPPPLPKRIAWPGGKIVSNKDDALASFLRRKLDQGQTLTPEQMAMLERMVNPNAPASAVGPASAGGKRQKHTAGNGRGSGGGGCGVIAGPPNARNLLNRLERKVAGAPDPFEAVHGGGGGSRIQGLASSSKPGRRKVDLSALKRGGGGQAAGRGGGGGGRRVISDGQGGFTIATTRQLTRPQQGASNKRPRGVAAGAEAGVAAAAADIPAVYREATGFVNNTGGGGAGKNKGKNGGKVAGKRKKGFAQQQQKWKGGVVNTKSISSGSGFVGGGGGAGGGGADGDRSLEDLMSGGLTGRR